MSDQTTRLATALAERYRIEGELGAGGMATVWLGEDLRHARRVAIKVLRPELAAVIGGERFLHEIRVTANLQHPHILPLHDSGEADGLLYYVMPYVEGESLRDRLVRERQLGLDDALRITREVAGALDYAHRHGVIHRDIKPENILLHDGQALVADFGIALAVSSAGRRLTETGLSLGTPHYMSPEQATGDRIVDSRSDIYSLGAVLYEMLAGEPPYTGPSAQAIVARVLTEKAPLASVHRDTVPPHVDAAIARALAKLPADRFHSAAELSDSLTRPVATTRGPGVLRGWLRDPRTLVLGAAALTAIGFALTVRSRTSGDAGAITTRVALNVPQGSRIQEPPTISPDGRVIAYMAQVEGVSRLHVRRMEDFETLVLEGTEEGRNPFFSPDGKALAFVRGEQLLVIPTGGGTPSVVVTASRWLRTGVWLDDGTILSSSFTGPLFYGSAEGSELAAIEPDSAAGERSFDQLVGLPDGRVLVGVLHEDTPRLALLSRKGAGWSVQRSGINGNPVGFLPPNRAIVRTESGMTEVIHLDLGRFVAISPPVPVLDSLYSVRDGSLSSNGTAAFLHSPRAGRRLVWVDMAGRVTPLDLEGGHYRWPRLAPDGKRLAIGQAVERRFSLSVVDLATGRVQVMGDRDHTEPTWTRDGRRLTFAGVPADRSYTTVYWQPLDGSGASASLGATDFELWPTDWSPDGRVLAVYGSGGTRSSNHLFSLDREGKLDTLVVEAGVQKGGRFSPDGRWLAYQSRSSGQWEVFVRPYPQLDRKWVVSLRGGTEPVWAPDGRTLYYRRGEAVMAVSVRDDRGDFRAETPRELFRGPFASDFAGDQSYDLHPDGRRFLMMEEHSDQEIRVIFNWAADLRRALEPGVR